MQDYVHEFSKFDRFLTVYVLPFAWHVLGAFAVWIFGSILIKAVQGIIERALSRKHVDPTLKSYARGTSGFLLRLLLIVAILDLFGIQTTSLSAVLAAAGVAIGVAFSGLLANFAAGIFLILFRPFRVGDLISAAGVTGTVREVGIFATLIDNGENSRIFVGNNKLFTDNILNYTLNSTRLVLVKVQLAHGVDPFQAIQRFSLKLQSVPGVNPTPSVTGEINEFNAMGIMIVMKFNCNPNEYAAMVTRANQAIYEVLKEGSFPIPEARTRVIPG